ncbi:putative sporulation associated protein [Phaeomoniella chlamydospora]|uniref:Putative sporulation associated protein n=1 Tax=Phaeomoniella chlamydospora TaxID=158046 RepID=A0A0G2EF29_PHACM|nr:putative sporulation associated protein [Phaeomoniella chlamydospora]
MVPRPFASRSNTGGLPPAPAATNQLAPAPKSIHPKRLVLCFDGTGNSYSGTTADTNVVKIYQKFDKSTKDQFHYYQPGIGTYTLDPDSLNLNPCEKLTQNVKKTLDQAAGLMFDAHVMAGYRFLMEHYGSGDRIFIFGFSRGAFTARFLARMICAVGILSRGNEEMVRFTYKRYQDSITKSGMYKGRSAEEITKDLHNFKSTFCRTNVMPYFLGLWDTVNSVGVFGLPGSKRKRRDEHQYDSVAKTAVYVRHAVAIDERRCKFRPALLIPGATKADDDNIEPQTTGGNRSTTRTTAREPVPKKPPKTREVFFAGNHCDIGGGYPIKSVGENVDGEEPMQLSDITLNWMLEELDAVNEVTERPEARIAFNEQKDLFQERYQRKGEEATYSRMHDTLTYHGGEKGSKILGNGSMAP